MEVGGPKSLQTKFLIAVTIEERVAHPFDLTFTTPTHRQSS